LVYLAREVNKMLRIGSVGWKILLVLTACRSLAQASTILFPQPTSAYISGTSLIPLTDPDFSTVSSLSDAGVSVSFSTPVETLTVSTTWDTWGSPPNTESDGPRVLFSLSEPAVELSFSSPLSTFGFEAQPNGPGVYNITAAFFNGAVPIVTISRNLDGISGARLFAASSDQRFTRVSIESDPNADGFAIAQLRVSAVPEPASGLLLGTALLGLMLWKRGSGNRTFFKSLVVAGALATICTSAWGQGNLTIRMDLAQIEIREPAGAASEIWMVPLGDGPFKTRFPTGVKFDPVTSRRGAIFDTFLNRGLLTFGSVAAANGSFVPHWGPNGTIQSIRLVLNQAGDLFRDEGNGANNLNGGNAFHRVIVSPDRKTATFQDAAPDGSVTVASIPPTQVTRRVIWMEIPQGPQPPATTGPAACTPPPGMCRDGLGMLAPCRYCAEVKGVGPTPMQGRLEAVHLITPGGRLAEVRNTSDSLGLDFPAELVNPAGATLRFQGSPAVFPVPQPAPAGMSRQQKAIYVITTAGDLVQIWDTNNPAKRWNLDYPAQLAGSAAKFQGSPAVFAVDTLNFKKSIYAIATDGRLIQLWDTDIWNLNYPAEFVDPVVRFQGSPAVFAVNTANEGNTKKSIYAITTGGSLAQVWDTDKWNLDYPAEQYNIGPFKFKGSPVVFAVNAAGRKKAIYAITSDDRLAQLWDTNRWNINFPGELVNPRLRFLSAPVTLPTTAGFDRPIVVFPSNAAAFEKTIFGITKTTPPRFVQMWDSVGRNLQIAP
jgi:hypothetical protein